MYVYLLFLTSQGSVVVNFVLVVNKKASSKSIESTLIDAVKARNLALNISPDVRLSGMFTVITAFLTILSSHFLHLSNSNPSANING